MLELRTDTTPIPDFQLGPGGEATPDQNPGEAEHIVEYTVGDPPGLPGDAKGTEIAGARNPAHHFSGDRTERYDDVRDIVIGDTRTETGFT